MSAVTFDRWEVGVDRRRGRSVTDANRMWVLRNAYVNAGWVIKKRPGLTKVATLEAGTIGLWAGLGVLNTFYATGSVTHADPLFVANSVPHASGNPLAAVHACEVFLGYLYVATEDSAGNIEHHYIDGTSPPRVTDVNCPNHRVIIKAAEKIWSPGDEVVRFCATGLPRDWTTAEDAGFLPTGLQVPGSPDTEFLGLYSQRLVAATLDTVQTWLIDPDPANHVLSEIIENAGTAFHRSGVNLSGDLYVMTNYGVRSLSTLALTQTLADLDVGSPVDALLVPELNGRLVDGREYVGFQDFSPDNLVFQGDGSVQKAAGTPNVWDAGAIGTKRLVGDGAIEWVVEGGGSYMIGLSVDNPGFGYTDIDFAGHVAGVNRTVSIRENGTEKAVYGNVPEGTVLGLRRTGTVITLEVNGVTALTFPTAGPATGTLMYVDFSILTAARGFKNLSMTAGTWRPINGPIAHYYQRAGQIWFVLGARAYVYTYSRTGKVSAWSTYEFPFAIDDMAELAGILYLRSSDHVYRADDLVYMDDTALITVDGEMGYQAMKKPGQLKHMTGFDAVLTGTAEFSFRYDASNPAKISPAVSVTGDSRPGGFIPTELVATEIAPVFRHRADEDFRLDMVTLYYEILGVF